MDHIPWDLIDELATRMTPRRLDCTLRIGLPKEMKQLTILAFWCSWRECANAVDAHELGLNWRLGGRRRHEKMRWMGVVLGAHVGWMTRTSNGWAGAFGGTARRSIVTD